MTVNRQGGLLAKTPGDTFQEFGTKREHPHTILPFYTVRLSNLIAPRALLHVRVCHRAGDLDPPELQARAAHLGA